MRKSSNNRAARNAQHKKACVIGAGPNGLAAAIVLAQARLEVEVFEAESLPGGAARTMDLTLPGFHHDFGSAVHPMASDRHSFLPYPCMITAWNGFTRPLRWRIVGTTRPRWLCVVWTIC